MSLKQKKEPLLSFDQLPSDIERRLRGSLRAYTYSAGETIFLQEAPAEAIYLVAHGRVKVVRVTPEGYENILCVRGPGDYFCPVPLLDGGSQLGSAIAMSDVTLFSCERSEFNSLCQDSPELLATVQADCISEVRHLLNRLEAFAFRSIKERLAITLLDQRRYQQAHNAPANEIHLTQKELAALVGASRERVSRILKQLEREGVVSLGRGRVSLRDVKHLKRMARAR